MKPGVYYDLSNDEYHSAPGLSRSNLVTFMRGFEYYEYSRDHKEEKDAFDIGEALHRAVLQPELFDQTVVSFDGTRRGKEWEKFACANTDKLIIKKDDYEHVIGMRVSVFSHPIAMNIIADSLKEVSIFWEQDGELLKVRDDLIVPPDECGSGIVFDLKTTTLNGADPDKFRRTIEFDGYGYDYQAGMYVDGTNACGEFGNVTEFGWIVVEKEPPYRCEVFVAGTEYVIMGQKLYTEALAEFKKYSSNNIDYKEEHKRIHELSASHWYAKKLEE